MTASAASAALAALAAAAAVLLAVPPPVLSTRMPRGLVALGVLGGLGVLAVGVLPALGVQVRAVPPLLIIGAAVAFALRLRRLRRERSAATEAAERVLALCEQVGADLASGQSPEAAFRAAARTWPEISEVAHAVALGGEPVTALRAAATAPGRHGLAAAAAALALADEVGTPVVPVLDRVAAGLRADRETALVVAGELASARATARLVALLPLGVLLLGRGTGGDPLRFLLTTAPGLGCLAAGLALAGTGVAWIDALADRAAGAGRPVGAR